MNKYNWKNQTGVFLTAQTISLFGSSIVQYAIIWYITLSTSSGRMLTLSTICGFLPQIIISLFAGVFIDQYDRKKIVMLSDSIIAVSTLVLALSFLAGNKNMWLLLAVLIIRSAGTGIQTPAVNAIIPQIVPTEHLMKINGIQSTLSSVIMFISPAISGVILSAATIEITFFIDIITAIIGVGITATVVIKHNIGKIRTENTYIKEIKNGFIYLKDNLFIKRLLMYQLIILFLISPSAFLTPLMVSRTYGTEVFRLTASEMTYSLGMIGGGLLITYWGGFKKKMNTTLLAGTFYGILMIGMGRASFFLLYLLCNTLIGVTSPCYNAPITVTIQEKVEPDMQGRIFSFMQIATSCALPLGMMFFGPLADFVKVQNLLITSGGMVAVISVLVHVTSALGKDVG